MIEAPLNVLMGAIVPMLKADPALNAIVGQGVYDRVPVAAVKPYISIGSAWEIQADADCIEAVEIGFRLDVWSEKIGAPEVRRIAHRVRSILHEAEIDLPEGALAMIAHRRTDTMRDPDGVTSHAVVEMTATIEL